MRSEAKQSLMQSKVFQMGAAAVLMLAGVSLAAVLNAAQAPSASNKPAAKSAAAVKPVATAKPLATASADAGTRYVATTANVASKDAIRIDLVRYSTDAERDEVLRAWQQAVARAAALAAAGGKKEEAGGRGGRGGRAGAADENNLGPEAETGTSTRNQLTPEGSLGAALDKAPVLGYLWSSEVSGYAVHYAVRLPQPDGGERVILMTDRRLGADNDRWKVASGTPNDYDFSIIELRLNSKGQGEGKISLVGKLAVDGANKVIALDNYNGLPVVLKSVGRQTLGKS